MKPNIAAGFTLQAMVNSDVSFEGDPEFGTDPQHVQWVLGQVWESEVTGEKAHRWLGWAQGVLAAHGVLTVEEAKSINKAAE